MGKGMMHYTKDGEYKGKTHKMDGKIHTGAEHSETSEIVSHNKKGPFTMKGYTYPGQSPMTFKGANSSNSKCWPGHAPKAGEPKTKMSKTRPGVRVNNCS
jgi:hypothetical protein